MNDHDRQNLQFLLNASPEVIKDWYRSVPTDDHEYALELLRAYSEELDRQSQQLRVEAELALLDTVEVDVVASDLGDAARVLSAFRL